MMANSFWDRANETASFWEASREVLWNVSGCISLTELGSDMPKRTSMSEAAGPEWYFFRASRARKKSCY